jgi:uncharacterized damage-inducible protein DinB
MLLPSGTAAERVFFFETFHRLSFQKNPFQYYLAVHMKRYFLRLYQYNAWSNKRVLDCLSRQNVADEDILTLMGHIVAAQFLWLHRIKGLPAPDLKLWGSYRLDQLIALSQKASEDWLNFVETTDDFNREMTYKNYLGDDYTNNVEMITIHLVNHSSYHRAQIAMLLRQKGMEPVNTDFITYDRVITGQLKD